MSTHVEIESLEGWLMKKKKQSALSFLGSENKRWFKVKEVQGADTKEWALCYFSSQHDKDAKGWIYLNDITEIKDDGKFFTVVSPQRTMQLEAQTPTQQRLWIRGLVGLCPNAKTSGLQTVARANSDDTSEAKHAVGSNEAKSDSKGSTTVTPRRGSTDSQSHSKSKHNSQNGTDRDAKDEAESKDDLNGDGIAAAGRDNINEEKQHSAPRSASRMTGEDHRLSGFRSGTSDSATTSRLHSHIRKDTEGSASPRTRGSSSRNIDGEDDNELSRPKSKDPGIFPPMEEDRDDRKERSRDRRGSRDRDRENRRAGGSASRERRRDADGSHSHDGSSDPSMQRKPKEKSGSNDDLETLDIEHQPVVRRTHRRRANSGSRVGDSDEEDGDSDARDDFAGAGVRVGRPPRPRRREDKSQARDDSEKAVDGGIIDNSPRISENDNNEDININADGATTAQSKAPTKRGPPPPPPTAPPPPSSAPPRRAKDILDSIGGSNGKLRKSMDEIIAETGMRKSFEAKGGGADADDSLDNAVDFKAEKQRRQSELWQSSELDADEKVDRSPSGPTKRPPLPPQGSRAPYAMPPTNTSSSSGSGANSNSNTNNSSSINAVGKSNTPPRKPSHPGTMVDPNFVDEDWDAELEERESAGKSRRKASGGGGGGSVIPGQAGVDSGVKSDENWLEADFDS